MAAPAGAHTSLVSSNPADGSITERAPERLELRFAPAVDASSLALELRRADGTSLGDLAATTRGTATAVEVPVPDLEPGAYVVSWVSVGDDGHRASGEIVFGVGAVGLDELRVASAAGGGLDSREVAGGILRWGVAAAMAVAAGGILAARWARRASIAPSAAGAVAGLAERLAHGGLVAGGFYLTARAGLVVWSAADAVGGPLGDALRPTTVSAGVAGAAVVAGAFLTRLAARRRAPDSYVEALRLAALSALALGSATLGHAGASDVGAPAVVTAAMHGVAAAIWLGPLLAYLALSRTRAWTGVRKDDRAAALRAGGRAFAPVAAVAFVALAGTGPVLALLDASWSELSSTFRTALIVKAAIVVAVVLPLGALHDRRVGWLASRRRPDRTLPGRASFAVEAFAMLSVLAVGASLATMNPRAGADGPDLLAVVDDPAGCEGLPTGAMSCYRRYLASVLDGQGPDAAAAELDRLAASVPQVTTECHQLAHDLGNDAVLALGGISAALAEAPPTCWSGYYHGVVELAVSQMSADPSGTELASTCAVLANAGRYSVPHYNCVHGLGHGVMLLTDHRIEPALDLCERVSDEWEKSSCLGGVFMERIISIQASPDRDDSNGDLLYPCSAVQESHLDECFLMQSSYFLWKLGYDYEEGFRLCDRAPASAVDTCYRSMGRDIAAIDRHEPAAVAEHCALGADAYFASCVEAAALDAALDAVDPAAGGPLCDVLGAEPRRACYAAVERTFGAA